jgi:hypothetical protein
MVSSSLITYIKLWPWLFGVAVFGILINQARIVGEPQNTWHFELNAMFASQLFLLLCSVMFGLLTALMFFCALFDPATGHKLQETAFDFMYHLFGFCLYTASSIWTLVDEKEYIENQPNTRLGVVTTTQMRCAIAAGSLGICACVGHLVHFVLSVMAYHKAK